MISKFQRLTIFVCAVIICGFTGNASADNASGKDAISRRPLIYLAGPLGFSVPGKQYQDNVLIPELIRLGYRVFDPWQAVDTQELANVSTIPAGQERVEALRKLNEKIGLKNAKSIEECDIVFAVLDGADVDSGTAAELGFAAAKNKPIVGYRSDFRPSGDNEGTMINLQVEHFIRASGGTIVKSLVEADSALSNTIAGRVFQNPTIAPSRISGPAATPDGIVNPDAAKVVMFFNGVFTIVLALALGEAFKQFVADKAEDAHARIMHWNRLPALIIFLVTIIPFFEGMNRYFDFRYNHIDTLLKLYPGYLLLDAIMFLVESFLFFVLARALSPGQIERTIGALIMLFAIDLVRDMVDRLSPIQEFGPWVAQNIADMGGLAMIYMWYKIQTRVNTSGAAAARQSRSKLADTSSQALPTAPVFVEGNAVGIVLILLMALLSFRGISTPSLPTQGEHRRSFYGNPASISHERFNEPFAVKVLYVIAFLSVISTFCDYYFHWVFYFPPPLK